jgi:hypothetical protein
MMVREAIEAYLDSHRATIWGRAFDLSEPKSREEAVELLSEVIVQVAARMLSRP